MYHLALRLMVYFLKYYGVNMAQNRKFIMVCQSPYVSSCTLCNGLLLKILVVLHLHTNNYIKLGEQITSWLTLLKI